MNPQSSSSFHSCVEKLSNRFFLNDINLNRLVEGFALELFLSVEGCLSEKNTRRH